MNKNFYLLIIFSFAVSNTYSQSSKSGSKDGGGSSQVGFVYYLKYKNHIQYASTVTESYYFTAKDLKKYIHTKLFGETIEENKQLSATFVFDRRVNEYMSAGLPSFKQYNIRSFQKSLSCIKKDDDKCPVPTIDTLLIVNIVYADSISRYWNKKRKGIRTLFTRARLRISIKQDSNILSARAYYPSFDDDKAQNKAEIINPSYVFRGGKRKATRSMNFNVDFNFSTVTLDQKYDDALKAYQIELYRGFRNKKDLPSSLTADAEKKYGELTRYYDLLLADYNKAIEKQNVRLDDLKTKISDPEHQDLLIENQMTFLNALYDLADPKKTKPPVIPPANLFDENVNEVAIPINRNDSAGNYYYKIIHKSILNQPMYFRSLHYGTWDYGTLTIPFRYRFPLPGKRIITTAGTAASAVPVPAESSVTLNIGVYLGRKWGHTRFYEDPAMTANTFSFEPVFFTGPTLIGLSLSNVDSSSRYVGAANKYAYTGPANILAWSGGLGMVMQWKTINFGFFGGFDIPFTKQTGWVYAYKPWLGFGIGVNLGILSSGNSVN